MKKRIFILLLSVISIGAFAQFEQGTKMVGGAISFASTTTKGRLDNTTRKLETSTDFSIAPHFGYFVIDRLAMGASLDFGLSKSTSATDDDEISYTNIQLAPFVRYYLPAGVFFEGQFGVGTSKVNGRDVGGTFEDKDNIFSWSLAAGYAILLNETVAIEPVLGYGSTNYTDTDNDYQRLNPGIFFQMGFQVYLR